MPLYVAFLRGMNVGDRRIKNDELCACFVAMGYTGVYGFLASGNVVFETGRMSAAGLEDQIEQGLSNRLGYEVPTFVRSAGAVTEIASRQPFPPAAIAASAGNVQIALLSTRPTPAGRESALAMAPSDDPLVIDGRDLYWLPKTTLSDSRLNLKNLGKIVGPMTIRTQRTMVRLATKLGRS